MSYWVYLVDKTAKPWCSYGQSKDEFKPAYEGDEPCPVPCYPCVLVPWHSEGGTRCRGGEMEASLNVTYNYSKSYGALHFELRDLDGMPARVVTDSLRLLVKTLGTEPADDYWAATPGNAGYALNILLGWAEQHPDATFVVH
jgi:hypothetical protein